MDGFNFTVNVLPTPGPNILLFSVTDDSQPQRDQFVNINLVEASTPTVPAANDDTLSVNEDETLSFSLAELLDNDDNPDPNSPLTLVDVNGFTPDSDQFFSKILLCGRIAGQ